LLPPSVQSTHYNTIPALYTQKLSYYTLSVIRYRTKIIHLYNTIKENKKQAHIFNFSCYGLSNAQKGFTSFS
ncbi:hypothetical protein MOE66_09820, partial [Bacillus atrophaeus]